MSKSGGLLQLVSTGRQDIYLTGNPQTTFFKQVYRRHTNFSVETQRIGFETAVDFGKLASLTIPHGGDLLSQLMLEIRLPKLNAQGAIIGGGCSGIATETPVDFSDTSPTFSWANGIGHAMIDYISFQVGQQEIDRQTGEWLHIWSQLTTPYSKYTGYNDMVGFQEVFNQETQPGPLHLYIPLNFWFCRNPGLALPLIALQSTPIRIYVKFKSGYEMLYSNTLLSDPCQDIASNAFVQDMTLWGDFIYLDVEERRRFTSSRHEYLIEQVQYIKRYSVAAGALNVSIPLNFNHPLKEIIWVAQQDRMLVAHEWFNFGSRTLNEFGIPNTDLIESAVLQFDGYDRFERQNARYFRLFQPWQRHTAIPNSFIYVYSFSLAPEASQPQGSCNASRLDSIVLQLQMNSAVAPAPIGVTVYATNYNVFRVVSGLGGLLFTV